MAHPARVWDYLLGGKDNFAADRTAGEQVLQVMPEMGLVAGSGRESLAGRVRYLACEAGIGSSWTSDRAARRGEHDEVDSEPRRCSRIVYADNDPIVLT